MRRATKVLKETQTGNTCGLSRLSNPPETKNLNYDVLCASSNREPIFSCQSDAIAAKNKADGAAAVWKEVSAQREKMSAELERAALTAKRNALLQGLVASEAERRKMASTEGKGRGTPFPYSLTESDLPGLNLRTLRILLLLLFFWLVWYVGRKHHFFLQVSGLCP